MNWQQLSFVMPGEISGAATEFLESLDSQAVTSKPVDSDDEFDLAEPTIRTWKNTQLVALFDENQNLSEVYDGLFNIFGLTRTDIDFCIIENQDWERVWLKGFKPIRINDELWICPSWCDIPKTASTVITLDPGLAFGTGTHPTTFLCLQALANNSLQDRTVLDVGCGSGILAIGALKLGASHAVATDIDPKAITATRNNATTNQVDNELKVLNADEAEVLISRDKQQFDIVVANILADALVNLKPMLLSALRPNGTLLLSGILDHQSSLILKSFSELTFETFQQDEWIALMGTRN